MVVKLLLYGCGVVTKHSSCKPLKCYRLLGVACFQNVKTSGIEICCFIIRQILNETAPHFTHIKWCVILSCVGDLSGFVSTSREGGPGSTGFPKISMLFSK